MHDVDAAIGPGGFRHHIAGGGHGAEVGDLLAVERLAPAHHLEAVVVGRVVTAGDHDGAVGRQRGGGVVQHGRGSAADADHVGAAGLQAGDQCRFQFRAGQPAVIADRDALAAVADDDAGETASDGEGVGRMQRLADDPADVVLAQYGRLEAMCVKPILDRSPQLS